MDNYPKEFAEFGSDGWEIKAALRLKLANHEANDAEEPADGSARSFFNIVTNTTKDTSRQMFHYALPLKGGYWLSCLTGSCQDSAKLGTVETSLMKGISMADDIWNEYRYDGILPHVDMPSLLVMADQLSKADPSSIEQVYTEYIKRFVGLSEAIKDAGKGCYDI